ncbi:hypothetical protein GYMLUDRAFT_663746 [Collybiopsis luxurians FD-317 M1]|uniref:Uncharacterized protein n=1 Tax=Collybiopsis luxurians FD-317 M1 TaxID=944289 RepID=A0A0D0CV70_9AGAR|nr:hypothetical protein GYMLUDRAFT_663746 [Collybiopsis luxurians FD-317 M1]
MSSESPSSLSSLARSKLHLDSHNLHRWVLLKNSIIHAVSSPATNIPSSTHTDPVAQSEVEDEENTEDTDSFMFPDAGKFVDSSGGSASEAQWLESLLETLGEDDEDEFGGDSGSVLQQDDEYDQILSPLPSPMSSSDDLINQSYLSSSFSYPYLAPYPPFHPPLVNSYHLDSSFTPSPYVDPLPYYDELDDLSVPDAIEDTSDDESDSPLTPSIQSSASLADPAAIPLPPDRPRVIRAAPHVFVDSDYSSFYPYELDPDPLPFSDDDFRRPYHLYQQEC